MSSFSAEEEGFEPPVPRGTTVFKTAAFDHSAIPLCDLTPYLSAAFINFQDVSPELDRKNNGSIESTKSIHQYFIEYLKEI